MPIDPRIPLGIEPVNFANKPFEGLRDVLAVQESQQRMQASRQKMQAEQQAQREAMAVRQILQETGGDWNAALPRIRQVAPGASLEIEQQLGEMKTKAADAMVKQFELEEKQEADTLAMLQFVRGNPTLYAELLPTFQKRVPKLPQQMWPAPDAPDLEQQLDRLSQINIGVIDQAKANQENVRLLLKGEFKAVERALGTADDAGDWDAALQSADLLLGLPRGTTKQQYGDYSPERVLSLQKGETGGAFTLTPGSQRFDAQGNVIAAVPANQGGSAGFTLSPGQTRYGPDGQPIAARPAAPARPSGTTTTNAALPAEYANALDRVILNLPAVRRPAIVNLANRLAASGDTDQLKEVIRQAAVDTEPVESRNLLVGRLQTIAALSDIKAQLRVLKASGVNTNLLTGTAEDVAQKLGTTGDPRLASIGAQIRDSFIQYRRSITGAAFSEQEGREYERLAPGYRNTLPLNEALIDGLIASMGVRDREFWTRKLGAKGASLVGAVPGGGATTTTPAVPTSGSLYDRYKARKRGGG